MKAVQGIKKLDQATAKYRRQEKPFKHSIQAMEESLSKLQYKRNTAFGNGRDKNIASYNKQIRKLTRDIEKLKNLPPESFFQRMKRMGSGNMLGSMFTIGGGVMLLRDSFSKFDEQAKADAAIKSGLISTNNAAGRSFDQLKKQAASLQKVTLFGDEQTQEMQALMLTFANVRGEVFDRTIPAVQDLATKMKVDGKSAAIQLGKALNDPKTGLTMLSRSGITFSEEQKKVIYSLQETGQMAKAQGVILEEIEKQFGGSAKAAALAGMGPMQQLGNLFGDFQENISAFIMTAIVPLARWLKENFYIVEFGLPIIAGIIAAIKVWTFVQRVLNITMSANVLGVIILAIAALIAAIIALVKYTEGWAMAWSNLKAYLSLVFKNIGLSFKQVFQGVKAYYMTIIDGIVLSWKWAMNKIGRLSDEEYARDKAAIQQRMKDRVNETIETAKKIKENSVAAKIYGKAIFQSIKIKTKKEESAGAGGTGSGEFTPTTDPNTKAGIDGINQGGSRPTNINITIGKFQDAINVFANNVDEAVDEIEEKITRKLVEVLNKGNQLQGV